MEKTNKLSFFFTYTSLSILSSNDVIATLLWGQGGYTEKSNFFFPGLKMLTFFFL